MSTNDEQKRTRNTVTSDGLRKIAALIANEVKGYLAAADLMDERKVKSIDLTGLDTLEKVALKRIRGNVVAARRAIDDKLMGNLASIANEVVENRKESTEKRAKRQK